MKKKVLFFLSLLYIFLNIENTSAWNTDGLNMYSQVYKENIELKEIYKEGINIFAAKVLNQKAKNNTILAESFLQNESAQDIFVWDIYYSDLLKIKNGDYSSIPTILRSDITTITSQDLEQIRKIVLEYIQELSESTNEQLQETRKIQKSEIYSDGNLENSDYDLLVDISNIHNQIFGQPGEYIGTHNEAELHLWNIFWNKSSSSSSSASEDDIFEENNVWENRDGFIYNPNDSCTSDGVSETLISEINKKLFAKEENNKEETPSIPSVSSEDSFLDSFQWRELCQWFICVSIDFIMAPVSLSESVKYRIQNKKTPRETLTTLWEKYIWEEDNFIFNSETTWLSRTPYSIKETSFTEFPDSFMSIEDILDENIAHLSKQVPKSHASHKFTKWEYESSLSFSARDLKKRVSFEVIIKEKQSPNKSDPIQKIKESGELNEDFSLKNMKKDIFQVYKIDEDHPNKILSQEEQGVISQALNSEDSQTMSQKISNEMTMINDGLLKKEEEKKAYELLLKNSQQDEFTKQLQEIVLHSKGLKAAIKNITDTIELLNKKPSQ